ncbi:3-deoxy-D-manno-octulosonate 8-phosphate phosphatase [Bacteroidia bacterium]|nr:3-deoxy-D-manno-octulosonate 8-phosphate phosphatase [Bacteroidia bacterium]GHU96103.1 3-deoxy-D-manno-octulosonate 8-phosphate phosphatase [Bacteroidia bacterium]
MNYKTKLYAIKAFVFDVDGVFTNGLVLATPEGDLLRQHNSKDGYAVRYAVAQGYHIGIISGGASESIRKRFAMLGVSDVYLGHRDKSAAFAEFCEKYHLESREVLVMGDDIPDISILQASGCATCPADAVQEVRDVVVYISSKKGGEGCVRDVIEQTLKLQDKWNLTSYEVSA